CWAASGQAGVGGLEHDNPGEGGPEAFRELEQARRDAVARQNAGTDAIRTSFVRLAQNAASVTTNLAWNRSRRRPGRAPAGHRRPGAAAPVAGAARGAAGGSSTNRTPVTMSAPPRASGSVT